MNSHIHWQAFSRYISRKHISIIQKINNINILPNFLYNNKLDNAFRGIPTVRINSFNFKKNHRAHFRNETKFHIKISREPKNK